MTTWQGSVSCSTSRRADELPCIGRRRTAHNIFHRAGDREQVCVVTRRTAELQADRQCSEQMMDRQ